MPSAKARPTDYERPTGTITLFAKGVVEIKGDRRDEGTAGYTVLAGKTNLLGSINAHLHSGRFLDAASEQLPTVVLGSDAASGIGFPDLTPGGPAPQVYLNHDWFTVIDICSRWCWRPTWTAR